MNRAKFKRYWSLLKRVSDEADEDDADIVAAETLGLRADGDARDSPRADAQAAQGDRAVVSPA